MFGHDFRLCYLCAIPLLSAWVFQFAEPCAGCQMLCNISTPKTLNRLRIWDSAAEFGVFGFFFFVCVVRLRLCCFIRRRRESSCVPCIHTINSLLLLLVLFLVHSPLVLSSSHLAAYNYNNEANVCSCHTSKSLENQNWFVAF